MLDEPHVGSYIDNKDLNFEYAIHSGDVINLSKKQIAEVLSIKNGEKTHDFKILNSDYSLKSLPNANPTMREVKGWVLRGGYS